MAERFAIQIQKRLNPGSDIIFSPSSIPIALVDSHLPKVFYTDSSFAGMVGFYESYTTLCNEAIRYGNYLEQAALETSELAIYASDWAANTAIENYNVDPGKIKIVPFGANLECDRDLSEAERIARNRSHNMINLLFYGADWIRKGGEFAIKVAKELNDRGLRTNLHIIGINKLPSKNVPDFILNHGFISKQTKKGSDKIEQLLAESHFILLPAIAECSGVVLCEANSFGVPCLATHVGGLPTVIKEGINGKTFPPGSSVSEWCDFIIANCTDNNRYLDFCRSSFNEYDSRLNWEVAGRTIMRLLKEM